MSANTVSDLISLIASDLRSAGDALYEARIKFGELRKMMHAPMTPASQPTAPSPVPAAAPLPPAVVQQLSASGRAAIARGEDLPSPTAAMPIERVRTQANYTLNGQPVYVSELARMAGCSVGAMQSRLREAQMTPEAAVAAGARMPRGARSHKQAAGKRDAGVAAPVPTRAPSVFDARSGGTVIAKQRDQQMGPRAFSPDAEVIVPDGVKRIVAPTPPDRFAVQVVPQTFGRIGQYEHTGSAVERAELQRAAEGKR